MPRATVTACGIVAVADSVDNGTSASEKIVTDRTRLPEVPSPTIPAAPIKISLTRPLLA